MEELDMTQLRENGLALCSAAEFEPSTEQMTVWLRENIADRIIGDEAWRVCMLKTDVWRGWGNEGVDGEGGDVGILKNASQVSGLNEELGAGVVVR